MNYFCVDFFPGSFVLSLNRFTTLIPGRNSPNLGVNRHLQRDMLAYIPTKGSTNFTSQFGESMIYGNTAHCFHPVDLTPDPPSGRFRISCGGRQPCRGHQLPMRLCFRNFLCQNERTATLRGRVPSARPESATTSA